MPNCAGFDLHLHATSTTYSEYRGSISHVPTVWKSLNAIFDPSHLCPKCVCGWSPPWTPMVHTGRVYMHHSADPLSTDERLHSLLTCDLSLRPQSSANVSALRHPNQRCADPGILGPHL